MLDQHRPDFFADAGQIVAVHPSGMPASCRISIILAAMIGGLLGRLHDDGVARDQRGGGHAAEDRQREIPRRDDDAIRRAARRNIVLFPRHDRGAAAWRAAHSRRSSRRSRWPRHTSPSASRHCLPASRMIQALSSNRRACIRSAALSSMAQRSSTGRSRAKHQTLCRRQQRLAWPVPAKPWRPCR